MLESPAFRHGEYVKGFVALILLLIYRVAMGFVYNKSYTENLLREGFEPVGDSDKTALKFAGLYREE